MRRVRFRKVPMPIYAYEVREGSDGCERCRRGFEVLQSLREAPIARCPDLAAVGMSQSGLDDRAKAAGFTKLKRLGKGEYEREY